MTRRITGNNVVVKPPKNRRFGGITFWEGSDPKFWTTVFKSDSHANMWQILVEFLAVTSVIIYGRSIRVAGYNQFDIVGF